MRKFLTIFICFWVGTAVLAQDKTPYGEAEVDALAERALKAFDIPGLAIGIVKDGEVIHAKGYGKRDMARPETVDADTLFQIASVSKAMTTAALAILMDEGKLTWDDKVISHIPEFKLHDPWVTREFTIRDLLTHRSGLPLGAGDLLLFPDADDTSIEDVLNALYQIPPTSSFRTEYDYDNLMYAVAGEVVARASGMSWAEFVETRIFEPLGMECYATHPRVPAGANEAMPHAYAGDTMIYRDHKEAEILGAAGGVNCNINGMTQWILTQLNFGVMPNGEQLFSKERHADMWTPHTLIRANIPTEAGKKITMRHYALGWRIDEMYGKQTVGHTGGLGGMLSVAIMLPEENMGIIILTNQQNGWARNAIISEYVTNYLNVPEEMTFAERAKRSKQGSSTAEEEMKAMWENRKKGTTPMLPLTDYAMTYEDSWYGKVHLTLENGKLRFSAETSPNMTGTLKHFQNDTFVVIWDNRAFTADAFLTFKMTPLGEIEAIEMSKFDPRTDFSFDFHHLDLRPVK